VGDAGFTIGRLSADVGGESCRERWREWAKGCPIATRLRTARMGGHSGRSALALRTGMSGPERTLRSALPQASIKSRWQGANCESAVGVRGLAESHT
jgi:hypothetical protein